MAALAYGARVRGTHLVVVREHDYPLDASRLQLRDVFRLLMPIAPTRPVWMIANMKNGCHSLPAVTR